MTGKTENEREKCISQALNDIADKLAKRPPDRYGRRFVITRHRAAMRVVFCLSDETGALDGPLQQELTLTYGRSDASLLAQLWPTPESETDDDASICSSGITPSEPDNPSTWTGALTRWVEAVLESDANG